MGKLTRTLFTTVALTALLPTTLNKGEFTPPQTMGERFKGWTEKRTVSAIRNSLERFRHYYIWKGNAKAACENRQSFDRILLEQAVDYEERPYSSHVAQWILDQHKSVDFRCAVPPAIKTLNDGLRNLEAGGRDLCMNGAIGQYAVDRMATTSLLTRCADWFKTRWFGKAMAETCRTGLEGYKTAAETCVRTGRNPWYKRIFENRQP